jgi:hypothetical protein
MTMTLAPVLKESRVDAFLRVKRINELTLERNYEQAERWETEADIEGRREVDLTFGSVSYEYRLPRDGFGIRMGYLNSGGELDTIFLHGWCALFAWAAHERTGLPFRVFTHRDATPEHWQGHVGLDLGDGHYLDITGRGTISTHEMRDLYTGETLGREAFLERLVDAPHRASPLHFLEELERLITEQAAYEVLEQAGLLQR